MVVGAVRRIVHASRADLVGCSAEDMARVLHLAVEKAAPEERLQLQDGNLMLHSLDGSLPNGQGARHAGDHQLRATHATLSAMKAKGTPAYVGMCCSNFFIKRHRIFQAAGMPAVLMDISGANYYEVKEENAAYAGQFKAQANPDMQTVRQVVRFLPVPAR